MVFLVCSWVCRFCSEYLVLVRVLVWVRELILVISWFFLICLFSVILSDLIWFDICVFMLICL